MTIQTPLEPERLGEQHPAADGYRAVLENKSFLALWIGQVLSQLGDRIVFVVFLAIIVHHFGSNDTYNSFLYIAFTIPAILLTAIAGVFVDRWPRRATLVMTNVLRAILVACLPWMDMQSPLGIYVLAFFLSAATQFFVPAEAATIPMIVRKNQLITANSMFTTTMMGSVIFGFAMGDPLIAIFSLNAVHWPIVTLFFLSALALMFVRPPASTQERAATESTPPKGIRQSFRDFAEEMRDGISYICEHPILLRAMLKLALLFSSVVALCILFVSYSKAFLYTDPEVATRKFAYIITFSGVGMVLGAYIVGQFCRHARRGLMVFGGFSAIGTCLLLLCLVGGIPQGANVYQFPVIQTDYFYLDAFALTVRMAYTYVLVSLMGMGAAFVAIPLQALLHELIPEDKRGKILGVQFTILSTCSTLPVLLAGFGAECVGVTPMLLFIGTPLLLLGLYGLYVRLRHAHADSAPW